MAAGLIAVTSTATAATLLAGTPPFPATVSVTVPCAPTRAFGVPRPLRVSRMRLGEVVVKVDPVPAV